MEGKEAFVQCGRYMGPECSFKNFALMLCWPIRGHLRHTHVILTSEDN